MKIVKNQFFSNWQYFLYSLSGLKQKGVEEIYLLHTFFNWLLYEALEACHDLVKRLAAGDELARRQTHQWLICHVEMFEHIGLIFIDVEKTRKKLLLTSRSFQHLVGGIAVCGIVSSVKLLEL